MAYSSWLWTPRRASLVAMDDRVSVVAVWWMVMVVDEEVWLLLLTMMLLLMMTMKMVRWVMWATV